MLSHLASIEIVIPTVMSILALALFTQRTRWLAYATVVLSITSELMSTEINPTALAVCISCFVGLILLDSLRTYNNLNHYFASK